MSRNWQRPFTRNRLNQQPAENSWYLVVLLGLLLLFWVYARYIERVDIPLMSAWLNDTFPILPDSSGLAFIAGFFHVKVMRHIIAVAVGWYFAYDAAVVLVRTLYDLPDKASARRFLGRLLGPMRPSSTVPEVAPAMLAERNESVLLRVGGPGQVKVPPGHVMVTELNGRFRRLLTAGNHTLGRYEYIHAVLNLQPQRRTLDQFTAYSRDGIELSVGVSIVYRLMTGGQSTTRNPYPFDETAVRKAAYVQTVVDDNGTVVTWEETPINLAKFILVGILSGYRLDEIIFPEGAGEEPYRTLRDELSRKLSTKLADLGIDLQAVSIHRLDLPSGVTEQYVDYWKSHWESKMLLNMIDGKATAVEEVEIARAEAEITMIQAIQEGIQRAAREGATAHMQDVVALRLVEALEMMARQSQQLLPLPNSLLPQLESLRKQLGAGDFDPKLPGKLTP